MQRLATAWKQGGDATSSWWRFFKPLPFGLGGRGCRALSLLRVQLWQRKGSGYLWLSAIVGYYDSTQNTDDTVSRSRYPTRALLARCIVLLIASSPYFWTVFSFASSFFFSFFYSDFSEAFVPPFAENGWLKSLLVERVCPLPAGPPHPLFVYHSAVTLADCLFPVKLHITLYSLWLNPGILNGTRSPSYTCARWCRPLSC